jgi:hypothetical protein
MTLSTSPPSAVSKLRHIVMWTLKEEAEGHSKQVNVLKARDLLLSCAQLVPGIEFFEVGYPSEGLECTADLILNSVFKDMDTLQAYQNHPTHVALKPFMKAVVQQRQCMDYWI